jgi:hypothetical protein
LSAAVLLLSASSVCPALHESLHHHDSDSQAEHQCPICLFAKGAVDAPEIPPCNAAFSSRLVATVTILPRLVLPATHYRLLPERAPPSVLSHSIVAG